MGHAHTHNRMHSSTDPSKHSVLSLCRKSCLRPRWVSDLRQDLASVHADQHHLCGLLHATTARLFKKIRTVRVILFTLLASFCVSATTSINGMQWTLLMCKPSLDIYVFIYTHLCVCLKVHVSTFPQSCMLLSPLPSKSTHKQPQPTCMQDASPTLPTTCAAAPCCGCSCSWTESAAA